MKKSVSIFLALMAAIFTSQVLCSEDLNGPTAGGQQATYQDEEDMKTSDSSLKHQSPINIRTTGWRNKREMFMVSGDQAFQYQYGALQFSDAVGVGPHGVMFAIPEDQQGHLRTSAVHLYDYKVNNMTFIPKQFHFHSGITHADPSNMGSEHTYNGKHFALELHIVHMNMDPNTQDFFKAAVVGVMFKAQDTDKLTYADHFLRKLFSGESVDCEMEFINHLDLVHRYVYRGSLTTPPYSEFLLWNMVARIPRINYETLKLFRHKVSILDQDKSQKLFGQSNRDVQPLNGRKIYEITDGPGYHEK